MQGEIMRTLTTIWGLLVAVSLGSACGLLAHYVMLALSAPDGETTVVTVAMAFGVTGLVGWGLLAAERGKMLEVKSP